MTTDTIAPYRLFIAQVARVRDLSPSFRRVTFTGADLDRFADNGYDQRIKLVLPLPRAGLAHLPHGPDWYTRWRALPDGERNPVRTYTVRRVRPDVREVDVDVVRHGGGPGPAARWVESVQPGDAAALVGPDAGYPGNHGGVAFRPPAGDRRVLLAGDETAVPAIAGILERLPAGTRGEALLEVPYAADVLSGDAFAAVLPSGMEVRWLPRDGQPPGSLLVPEAVAAAARLAAAGTRLAADARLAAVPAARLAEVDVDRAVLWEVPADAPAGDDGPYVWLAGEAGAIRTLRRRLVGELGLDRGSVACMGYWRLGRSEDTLGA